MSSCTRTFTCCRTSDPRGNACTDVQTQIRIGAGTRTRAGTLPDPHRWSWVRASLTVVVVAFGAGSCIAHTSYQSARIVAPGKEHVTFAAGRTTVADDDRDATRWWSGEFMTRHNLSPSADIGFKLAVAGADGGGTFTTSLDSKRALVKDRLAFNIGLGLVPPALQSIHVFPGVIATQPLTRHVDVNAAAKLVFVPGAMTPQPAVAYNIGLDLRLGNSGFGLRPEIAVLDLRDGNAKWIQFGVGVSLPYIHSRDGQ